MKMIAQKMFEQAVFNSPLGVQIAWNTTVGSMLSGTWMNLRTLSGSMTVMIDYGDGTIKSISCNTSGAASGQQHTYGAAFGSGVTKTMRIIIPDRFNVVFLSIDGVAGLGSPNAPTASAGPIPVELSRLVNLGSLRLSNHLFTDIPASILDLENLHTLNLRGCFGGNLSLQDTFPDKLLYKEDGSPRSLVFLGHSIRNHGNGAHVGYDRLADLASTLESLNIQTATGVTSGVSNFPPDLLDLVNLKSLSYNQTGMPAFPDLLNGMPSLEQLVPGLVSGVIRMDNVPGLVNLVTLNLNENGFNVSNKTSVEIATDWIPYTKLKSITLTRNFTTTGRADAFVNHFYDVVTAYAPLTGTSSDQFRNMAITFNLNGTLSGTFQQPSGYAPGVSNGSPSSPQEKRWVLINQYEHVWSM